MSNNLEKMIKEMRKKSASNLRDYKDKEYHGKKSKMKKVRAERKRNAGEQQ